MIVTTNLPYADEVTIRANWEEFALLGRMVARFIDSTDWRSEQFATAYYMYQELRYFREEMTNQ